jgi:alpha-L-fucosidase
MLKQISLIFSLLLVLGTIVLRADPQPEDKAHKDARMAWWRDAKFGMFIHWGVYSVPAGYYKGQPVPGLGEWIMNKAKIPRAEYQAFAPEFNPTKFDADAFVKTAKDAGMKYMVITAKHHDGFAMFNTEYSNWNIYKGTPFGRDPLAELAAACKRQGMRLGIYYSQAQDWNNGGAAAGGRWDKTQGTDMDAYIDKVAVPQVRELLSNYGPLAVLWWDTPIDMTKDRAQKLYDAVESLQPQIIQNNRLGGGFRGDTETPEQFIPATGFPGRDWETCMTINDTWGFKKDDDHWKSTQTLLTNLVDIASKGGNYLLNVGPNSEGQIPQASIDRLAEIGKWMKVNGDSIYGTTASPFPYLAWGRATSKGDTLYLHVFQWPQDGILKVPMTGDVVSAHLLAGGAELKAALANGHVEIAVPKQAPDAIDSVIVLKLKGDPRPIQPPTLHAAATASSEDGANKAANAFDGDQKTHWSAAAGQATGWLQVDLGKPLTIGASIFTEPNKAHDHTGISYQIQYMDGGTWKTVAEGSTGGRGDQKNFPPVTAQLFRLNITKAKWQPGISEWELFQE